MKHLLPMIVYIMTMVNNLDPFYREAWVTIESDNINADSAEASYHVAHAVSSAVYEAMLFVLRNVTAPP